MTDQATMFRGSDAALGWSLYARFYAWRFS
jgi:hypothetical protein